MALWEMVFLTEAGELERTKMTHDVDDYYCQPVAARCLVWASVFVDGQALCRVTRKYTLMPGDVLKANL